MIGKIIGNYKIEAKLGEGGMGAVYKGVDTMLDREVAIKALRPELTSQNSVVERFRSEAVTLAKLNHPNIAALYTLFREGEELYMVLEFVRGETLDSILQKRGALPASEAVPVFCQVLDGIDHAHEFGIVHRDIKPANIMLTENGKLKVLDFGIARILGSTRMTRAGSVIGTLEYMAPEQIKGHDTDARADIYSLGMMLYEVLTGRTPFGTDNEFELMRLQIEAMPAVPRLYNPDVPVEVEEAIMRAIAKKPEDRFQTAGEFRETLLEAGFSAVGSMRGATAARRQPTLTEKLQPPVSQSVAPSVPPPSMPSPPAAPPVAAAGGNSMKATRMGEPVAAPPVYAASSQAHSSSAAKPPLDPMLATRIAMPSRAELEREAQVADQATPSFFSRLTWIHYAGAGAGVLILLGSLAVAAALVIGVSRKDTKATEVKKTDQPAVKDEKPAIVTMPTQQQPTLIAPSSAQPNQPLATSEGGELKPLTPENGALSEKPAQKPIEKREAAAPKPPAVKPPAAKKPAAKKPSAECLLTDDC